jgi:hypothetical protein
MRQAGSRFASVTIRPFVREVGQSREVALRRIVRVFGEIARYRMRGGNTTTRTPRSLKRATGRLR